MDFKWRPQMKNVPNVPCHKSNPERTAFPAVQAAAGAQSRAASPTTIERLGQSVTIDKLATALRWYAGSPRGKGLGASAKALTHREQLEDDGGEHARRVLKELGL